MKELDPGWMDKMNSTYGGEQKESTPYQVEQQIHQKDDFETGEQFHQPTEEDIQEKND